MHKEFYISCDRAECKHRLEWEGSYYCGFAEEDSIRIGTSGICEDYQPLHTCAECRHFGTEICPYGDLQCPDDPYEIDCFCQEE